MSSSGIVLPFPHPLFEQHPLRTLMSMSMSMSISVNISRSLAPPRLTPALRTHIITPSNTNTPRTIITPRSPRPARASRNRQVVKSEAKPTRRDTDQTAEQDIEAEMAVVHEAGGAHVDGCADGHEDENECVDGRRGVLVADGDDGFLCVGRGSRDAGLLLLECGRDFLLKV